MAAADGEAQLCECTQCGFALPYLAKHLNLINLRHTSARTRLLFCIPRRSRLSEPGGTARFPHRRAAAEIGLIPQHRSASEPRSCAAPSRLLQCSDQAQSSLWRVLRGWGAAMATPLTLPVGVSVAGRGPLCAMRMMSSSAFSLALGACQKHWEHQCKETRASAAASAPAG